MDRITDEITTHGNCQQYHKGAFTQHPINRVLPGSSYYQFALSITRERLQGYKEALQQNNIPRRNITGAILQSWWNDLFGSVAVAQNKTGCYSNCQRPVTTSCMSVFRAGYLKFLKILVGDRFYQYQPGRPETIRRFRHPTRFRNVWWLQNC